MMDGVPYIYKCKSKQYKLTKNTLGSQISQKRLVNECHLHNYGDNFHIILKIK